MGAIGRPAPVRRTPVQGRSSGTVQQIFRAASALLGRTPLEDITTSRIAVEAGVSVGALYRFFPDKQAIIDGIAVQRVEEFRASLEECLAASEGMEAPAFLDMVIDAYVAFVDAHPDFRTIALGRHISASTRARQVRPDVGPAAIVRRFVLERLGMEAPPDLDLKLRIVSETGDRLIAYAYEQPSAAERAQVIAELKRLLAAYLF
ncbi:MAG: TetR/AcrR family transcriptional regulator [Bryobacteraceae bacterium]|jgi:AcrR family transcriptional regulator